jgi:SAM-dependent methyltransferase
MDPGSLCKVVMLVDESLAADPTNADQVAAWNGPDGEQWARSADRFDASMREYQGLFFDAAAITPTHRVLDIGCGTGQTSRLAGRLASEGSVLGVDLSSQMLQVARQRTRNESLDNVSYVHGDAQVFEFEPDAADVAISRNGSMFFGEPVVAFSNIRGALRPGGRLTLLAWQHPRDNEWLSELGRIAAMGRSMPPPPISQPGPFAMADPVVAMERLTKSGFDDVSITPVTAPMYFGDDVDQAAEFLMRQFRGRLADLSDDDKRTAERLLVDNIADHLTPSGVAYQSAAWLVTALR